jgi:hypothetical protein
VKLAREASMGGSYRLLDTVIEAAEEYLARPKNHGKSVEEALMRLNNLRVDVMPEEKKRKAS